jgi:hypothetical protein
VSVLMKVARSLCIQCLVMFLSEIWSAQMLTLLPFSASQVHRLFASQLVRVQDRFCTMAPYETNKQPHSRFLNIYIRLAASDFQIWVFRVISALTKLYHWLLIFWESRGIMKLILQCSFPRMSLPHGVSIPTRWRNLIAFRKNSEKFNFTWNSNWTS